MTTRDCAHPGVNIIPFSHYNDVIMSAIASQITSLTVVCLLNRLIRRVSKKTSKLRVTGLCVWNSPVTGEFPAQRASDAENTSIWWRHHGTVFVQQANSKEMTNPSHTAPLCADANLLVGSSHRVVCPKKSKDFIKIFLVIIYIWVNFIELCHDSLESPQCDDRYKFVFPPNDYVNVTDESAFCNR